MLTNHQWNLSNPTPVKSVYFIQPTFSFPNDHLSMFLALCNPTPCLFHHKIALPVQVWLETCLIRRALGEQFCYAQPIKIIHHLPYLTLLNCSLNSLGIYFFSYNNTLQTLMFYILQHCILNSFGIFFFFFFFSYILDTCTLKTFMLHVLSCLESNMPLGNWDCVFLVRK